MVAIIQSFSKKISSYHSRVATPKLMILWSNKKSLQWGQFPALACITNIFLEVVDLS